MASAADALGDVDACLVYSEPSQHGRIVATVRARSLPCFIEKPLAPTGGDALVVARIKPAAQVGYFLRYWPALGALRSCLRDGHIGRPSEVSVRFVHDGLTRGWFDDEYRWMRSPREGGGGFFDLAGHCVDAAGWIVGHELVSTGAGLTGAHHGEASLVDGRGVRVHVEAGWEAPALDIRCLVVGDAGRAAATVDGLAVEGPSRCSHPGSSTPLAAGDAVAVWLDSLTGRHRAPLVPVEAAARNVHVIDDLRARTAGA